MSELIKSLNLGDISFGAPIDIPLLHSPWGYYKLLEVPTDASKEEIEKAFRRLSGVHHPDAGGNEEMFKALSHVKEILTDDGGELGEEHSKRRHYDEVCSLD